MTIKKLVRKNPVNFTVRPMTRRFTSVIQERASLICELLDSGKDYQSAIREADRRMKNGNRT